MKGSQGEGARVKQILLDIGKISFEDLKETVAVERKLQRDI